MTALIIAVLQAIVFAVLFVFLSKTRGTLSAMRLDPDTIDAACLRVSIRQFRILLLSVAVLWVLQVVRVVSLILDYVTDV